MSRLLWMPPVANAAQSLFQLALAVLSGVLVALCFPPFNLWWLAWVALVPLGLSIVLFARLLEPLVGALIAGATLHLVALDWVRTCFESSGVTGPWASAWLAIAVAASPAWCAMALVAHTLVHRFAISASIALAIGWMTGDLARRVIAVFFTEMDFPWLQLAATQTRFPAVVQLADIVGAAGISGLIALVNGSFCDVLTARGHRARMRGAAPALILVALGFAYGAWRLSQQDHRRGPLVALVPSHCLPGTFEHFGPLGDKADILLWPEGAIQGQTAPDVDTVRAIERLAREARAIVAIGWYREQSASTVNSIAIADPEQGLVELYEKSYLVPWTEFTPSVGTAMTAALRSRFRSRSEHRTITCAHTRIALAVCYDACFPGLFRQFDAPDVFLVCSGESADKTMQMREHILQIVRLRAVEFRRTIVRNVAGGHSGVIDGSGRILSDVVDLSEPTVVGPIPIDDRFSLYARLGDLVLIVPLALVAVACVCRHWPNLRHWAVLRDAAIT